MQLAKRSDQLDHEQHPPLYAFLVRCERRLRIIARHETQARSRLRIGLVSLLLVLLTPFELTALSEASLSLKVLTAVANLTIHGLASVAALIRIVAWFRRRHERWNSPAPRTTPRRLVPESDHCFREATLDDVPGLTRRMGAVFSFTGYPPQDRSTYLRLAISADAVTLLTRGARVCGVCIAVGVSKPFATAYRGGERSDLSLRESELVLNGSRYVLLQSLVPFRGAASQVEIDLMMCALPRQLKRAAGDSVTIAQFLFEAATAPEMAYVEKELRLRPDALSNDGFPIYTLDMRLALDLDRFHPAREFAEKILSA